MNHLRRIKKDISWGGNIIRKSTFYTKKYFTEREYRILNLDERNIGSYLPESLRYQTMKINGEYEKVFNNKLIFYDFFKADIPLAKNLYFIDNKAKIVDLENQGLVISQEVLIEKLRSSKIVAKPISGGGGKGVFDVEYLGNETWMFNQNKIKTLEIKDRMNNLKNYLLTEFVPQSENTQVLNPQSTNTFRVMMIRSPKTGEVKTIRVLLRIGNHKTGIADNYDDGDGGLIGKVNLDKEYLEKVTMIDDDYYPIEVKEHPDHGVSFENRYFPGLKKAIHDLEKVFLSYPLINYVGWDLVLTKNGYRIIEANNHPSFMLAQIYEPLMNTKEAKEFYMHWMDLQ